MSLSKDTIQDKLLELGLEEGESALYLHLLSDSPKSVLELSRELKLGRNIVYRLVSQLQEKSLVKEVQSSSGLKVSADSYRNLELLIERKKRELQQIESSAGELFGSLAELASASDQSGLRYYSGPEGMRQITLHSLEAQKELLILEIAEMTKFMSYGEAEIVRQEFVKRAIRTRQLTNAKAPKPWTEIRDLYRHYWEPRYISPDFLRIDFEVLIHNDTVAMYSFLEDKMWGIEVYSPALASMQKQLFNFVWRHAKPMKIHDDGGASVV